MIDTRTALDAAVKEIAGSAWVALDTEADSLHAYPEKVCLVQVSIAGADLLIDPLARLDLTPLFEKGLGERQLLMHGADYDLRLLNRTYGFRPVQVFDTMEAARLLGLAEFSLGSLVQRYLGVELEKGAQKANWARRPLTERMAVYARNDTHYLKPLSDRLREELETKRRLAWHEQTCARLIEISTEPKTVDPERVWRIKGSHRLTRLGLCLLRELWHWREEEARASNKPPYFVLTHESLVAIADAAAHARPLDELVPHAFSFKRQRALADAISRGLAATPTLHPDFGRSAPRHPTMAERRRSIELKARRDRQARELGIDPTLIASRGTLESIAQDEQLFHQELMPWQQELLRIE